MGHNTSTEVQPVLRSFELVSDVGAVPSAGPEVVSPLCVVILFAGCLD